MSKNRMPGDPSKNLEDEGWLHQFTVEIERADEYVDLYKSLGMEVRIEAVTPELHLTDECSTCLLADCDKYVILFTRGRQPEDGS